jgi:hypothetical protein
MRSLILGVVLGALGSILVDRLRYRAKLGAAHQPSGIAPATGAETAAAHSGETTSEDLAQLTRQESYRRAQAAGISGCSEMSKAQLIAALRPPPARSGGALSVSRNRFSVAVW